jgi:alpha-L-fucosidase 2
MNNLVLKSWFAGLMVSMAAFSVGASELPMVDYEAFLGQHDMVWDRIPDRWEVAPYTGNGNVGFLFYQAQGEAKNVISIYAGRHDYYDHRLPHDGEAHSWIYRCRLPLGHFDLKSKGDITDVDLRMDLWNAELTGTIQTTLGSYAVRGLSHSGTDVILFETDADDEAVQISWHPEVPFSSVRKKLDSGGGPKQWKTIRTAPYELPPEPEWRKNGGMEFCKQMLYQERGETTTGWEVTGAAVGRQTLTASIHHSFPEHNSLEIVKRNLLSAREMLAAENGRSVDDGGDDNGSREESVVRRSRRRSRTPSTNTFISSHRRWWHDYYPLSFLTINDPEKEAFYWIQMYKLGSAMRENGPILDLMGPWYHDTFWPMVWGDLNVELQYWTPLTANRLSLGDSLPNNLDKYADNLSKNVPGHWKDSAAIAACFPQDCEAYDHGKLPDMLCWILNNYWLQCEFAGDRERMRDGLFPLLKKNINGYLNFLQERPVKTNDGKIHISHSWSPEYPGGRGQDINFSIALLRWGCQTLLDINEEHKLNDPLAAEWQNIIDNLVDFQIDENGLRIGKDIPFDKPHRHYSHLLGFYPLAVITPEKPADAEMLRTSLDHWLEVTRHSGIKVGAMPVTGYTATGAASMYACLGDPEMAYYYLDFLIQHNRVSPTTMYAEGNPVIESPLSFATSLHDMLLQSWGGTLRVFRGTPEQWGDVAFKDLRGQGAFLVSAKRKGGVTQFVSVKSLAGVPCVVQTDIPDPSIFIDGVPAKAIRRESGAHKISIKKGQTAVFTPVALEQTNLSIDPIPVEEKDRNLFGLNEKTTRLPGHQYYHKEKPTRHRPVAPKRKPVAKGSLPSGRFVRIELSGDDRVLSLAEVEVFAGGKDVALSRKAMQSTTVYGGVAARAVDGNLDNNYNNQSVTHTAPDGTDPWWEVDLGHAVEIDAIRITNRKGNSDRLEGFTLRILDENRKTVYTKEGCPARPVSEFRPRGLPLVRLQSTTGTKSWTIDTQSSWMQNTAAQTNLEFVKGMAQPTAEDATFTSVLKRFDAKRKAKSIVLEQSPVWENWEPVEDIGPHCTFDSPVFLSLGPDNYWFFARHNMGQEKEAWDTGANGPFVARQVELDGFNGSLLTTPIPTQFRAPGGQKRSLNGYHAWESRDMVNWVHHGPITDREAAWMTTAEYADGKAYLYYDFPNDQDPHLIIDNDLTDGEMGEKMGMAFDDPSHGSDCAFIRDLDGKFHVIYEDWSPIHANSHSFDSPLAGHAVSKDGKGDFKILSPAVDLRTTPTGVTKTYKHPHWVMECPERFSSDIGEYEVHEPEQDAFGDWSAICIGGQYYLFGDYDPAGSHGTKGSNMSVARFTSSSLDREFEFCGNIGQGHPDPDVCFAEGRFYLATQMETDYVSPGPWVERVEVRVGVDTDNDGAVDEWTRWQEIKEQYDYTPGFAKQVAKAPAAMDLSGLPEGYGFQFELKIKDTTENRSKPIIDRVSLSFR